MTDKQKLIDLLNGWGVPFVEDKDGDVEIGPGRGGVYHAEEYPTVCGYGGFIALFEFDENDEFCRVGVWE